MGKKKVIIVGGGASGLMAAVFAARNGAKVTLLEKEQRTGRKILATGNGRCNLSNRYTKAEAYHGTEEKKSFIKNVFEGFSVEDTISFFSELGIVVIEKESGKLYPRSEQASSVLNVLLLELERLKVEVLCNEDVSRIEIEDQIRVYTQQKKFYCNKLILATGGRSCPDLGSNGSGYQIAESIGHQIVTPFPSLVQLKTDYPYLKHLKGAKIQGTAYIYDEINHIIGSDEGEILFTDYGVSGPPILQVSRIAAQRFTKKLDTYLSIDLMPEYSLIDLDKFLVERFAAMSYKTMEDALIGLLHSRFVMPVLKTASLDLQKKVADLTKQERQALAASMKNLRMKVIGTQQWNQSQVTAGGVLLDEVDQKTLESKLQKNIYFCGEILDVDGLCGGYNLQWAWSTGAITGLNASKKEN